MAEDSVCPFAAGSCRWNRDDPTVSNGSNSDRSAERKIDLPSSKRRLPWKRLIVCPLVRYRGIRGG